MCVLMFRLTSVVVGRMILTTRLLKIIFVQHHFKRHFYDIKLYVCMAHVITRGNKFMFMLSFIFVIVCGFFLVEANLCRFFIVRLYM